MCYMVDLEGRKRDIIKKNHKFTLQELFLHRIHNCQSICNYDEL
jgi:hypothetical protein